MKKKVLFRCFFGGFVGIGISLFMSIIFSAIIGDGDFHPVPPALIADCGTELIAVVAQTVCSFLYGAAISGSTAIWEVESWSLLRQTATHFLVISFSMLPIAYLMHWMPHKVVAVIVYFAIFLAVYVIIWLINYFSMKKKLSQMNEKLN